MSNNDDSEKTGQSVFRTADCGLAIRNPQSEFRNADADNG